MKNDPGIFTDSTGEGMAGDTDVSLETQRDLANRIYNGDKACKDCGRRLDPVQSLLNELCASCQRRKHYSLLKGGMV